MPFLLALFALFVPRLLIVVLWLFSAWFTGLFTTWIIPVLGFLLLPYTLLWYSVVERWFAGEWGPLQIVILVIAVLADTGTGWFSRGRKRE
jgi:hypothetical protein